MSIWDAWFYLGAILFSLSTWRSEAVGAGHAPPDAWRYGWHRRVFAALQIAEVSLAFSGSNDVVCSDREVPMVQTASRLDRIGGHRTRGRIVLRMRLAPMSGKPWCVEHAYGNRTCGAIFRYPVKSMGGERLEVANLGWHGLDGDRRLAFRRIDDRGDFPWLSASKLPTCSCFLRHRREDGARGDLPNPYPHAGGREMPVFGEELPRRSGVGTAAPVQMMQFRKLAC